MSDESNLPETPVPFERAFWALPQTAFLAMSPARLSRLLLQEASPHRALLFALLTTLPLSALAGIIPFTHSMHFGLGFSVDIPSGAALPLDIARACAIGIIVFGGSAALLVACFTSLAEAFFDPEFPGNSEVDLFELTNDRRVRNLALRGALYTSWLVPCSGVLGLFGMLAFWASPDANTIFGVVVILAMLLPAMLIFLNLNAIATEACRLPTSRALVVATAAFLLMMITQYLLVGEPPGTGMLAPLLPETGL